MVNLQDLVRYTDGILETATVPDYSNALNGLQLENRLPVQGIAAAVDFSTRAIRGAIKVGANLLVVHHGMFWGGLEAFRGFSYKRMRLLLENGIAVYASHLPLDKHPTLGNNALLAQELGLEPSGAFARFADISIGLTGESDIDTTKLASHASSFARSYGGDARTSAIPEGHRTRRWAMCSGAGASVDTLREATTIGIDTLIVGEGPHWTSVFAEEHDLVIIYAGHYATETLGVRALARHLGEKFNLPWHFISAPTGL
jgi:dinuclear metal center YbgI/SA1388 family protein